MLKPPALPLNLVLQVDSSTLALHLLPPETTEGEPSEQCGGPTTSNRPRAALSSKWSGDPIDRMRLSATAANALKHPDDHLWPAGAAHYQAEAGAGAGREAPAARPGEPPATTAAAVAAQGLQQAEREAGPTQPQAAANPVSATAIPMSVKLEPGVPNVQGSGPAAAQIAAAAAQTVAPGSQPAQCIVRAQTLALLGPNVVAAASAVAPPAGAEVRRHTLSPANAEEFITGGSAEQGLRNSTARRAGHPQLPNDNAAPAIPSSTMTNEESRYGPDNVQAVPGDDKCPLDSCGVAAMCVFTLVSAALPSSRSLVA